MLDKMKQLMEVKKQAEQLKKELDASYAEVEEVPGIKIKISGSQNFLLPYTPEQEIKVQRSAAAFDLVPSPGVPTTSMSVNVKGELRLIGYFEP